MGCFSWLCSYCNKPINSNSFSGQYCMLILMEKGIPKEWMMGQYDSYGAVLEKSASAAMERWDSMKWNDICNLEFNNDPTSGIAAYHKKCWDKHKGEIEVSESDPNQGWGRYKNPKNVEFNYGYGEPPRKDNKKSKLTDLQYPATGLIKSKEKELQELKQIADDAYKHDQLLNFDENGNRLRQAVGENALWLKIRWLIEEIYKLQKERKELRNRNVKWDTKNGNKNVSSKQDVRAKEN